LGLQNVSKKCLAFFDIVEVLNGKQLLCRAFNGSLNRPTWNLNPNKFKESVEEHCIYASVSSGKRTTGALQLQLMLMLSILLNKKTCKYYILEAINRFT
uniref:Uncharacterized protein n=1 Tax=Glossina palpalis gambiensis TaxID=67801 RepID=A0A1B0BBR0_9MUSC